MDTAARHKLVADALRARGVELFTSACSCCGGVTCSISIDGQVLIEDEEDFNFNNFEQSAAATPVTGG